MFRDFEKWHGCANDFAVIWMSDIDGSVVFDSIKNRRSRLCERHTGIGADGILVLRTKTAHDLLPYQLTIINSDGTIAKNCGNGLRCAFLSILRKHEQSTNILPEAIELDVEGETMVGRFFPRRKGGYPFVAVEMGVPVVGDDVEWADEIKGVVSALAADNNIDVEETTACTLSNDHVVIKVTDATRQKMLKLGPVLQKAGSWDGVNVHIAAEQDVSEEDQARAAAEIGGSISESYVVKVWERGAGETMACGSGACAVGAVALASGLAERSEWIAVDMPGGRLYVQQQDENEPIVLAGPAVLSYVGKVEI